MSTSLEELREMRDHLDETLSLIDDYKHQIDRYWEDHNDNNDVNEVCEKIKQDITIMTQACKKAKQILTFDIQHFRQNNGVEPTVE